ncbi:MAG: GNAT family N-acetyltransferase [bacterium]|nr:GNAT family N-acetyltransferase [bacterium]
MNIRPAEEKDNSVLTSLHISQDLESFREGPDIFRGWKMSAMSSRARDIVLVAEDEGEIRGYIWAVAVRIFDYRIGIIFDMYVDPTMRRKGIGRQLLKQAMDELRSLKVRRFWANTEMKNSPTRALLESLGLSQSPEKVFFELVEPGAKHEWE